MSKHTHHQTNVEQRHNKEQGTEPLHYEKNSHQPSKLDDSSIQLRAYQIHREKGGSALDNWLEAEQMLGGTDKAVSRLINEGDPNTQILKKV